MAAAFTKLTMTSLFGVVQEGSVRRRNWQHLYQCALWAEGMCEQSVYAPADPLQLQQELKLATVAGFLFATAHVTYVHLRAVLCRKCAVLRRVCMLAAEDFCLRLCT